MIIGLGFWWFAGMTDPWKELHIFVEMLIPDKIIQTSQVGKLVTLLGRFHDSSTPKAPTSLKSKSSFPRMGNPPPAENNGWCPDTPF